MKTWTFPEVRPAVRGPWDTEPDKVQWIDESTGLDCLIVRNHQGALCGYVGVPPEHPLHGKGYSDLDLWVHGGLTFSSSCDEEAEGGRGICHVPEPGRPADVWWFGFDCGHHLDIIPRFLEMPSHFQGAFSTGTYRDLAYVKRECTDLADQLRMYEKEGKL